MLKRAKDMLKDIKEQVRGGKGSVEMTQLFKNDETYTKKIKFLARVVLNPGCSIGLHPHDVDEEFYYILKGKALFNDNGELKELLPGDATVTGGGTTHSLENIGDEPLEFMAIVA